NTPALTSSSMNWYVVAANSCHPAIRAAFDSSVPRMINMYFDIAFPSSGGRLSARAPTRRMSGARIDTAPEKSIAASWLVVVLPGRPGRHHRRGRPGDREHDAQPLVGGHRERDVRRLGEVGGGALGHERGAD